MINSLTAKGAEHARNALYENDRQLMLGYQNLFTIEFERELIL
jgi:hypothetical protein